MSGTSFDGVDASLIKTDGKNFIQHIHSITTNYNEEERKIYSFPLFQNYHLITKKINQTHKKAIKRLLKESEVNIKNIDIIGVHGQTFAHKPNEKWSWQYIDHNYLLKEFKTKIVTDFRLKDLNFGGEGAPIVPIFHNAVFKNTKKSGFPLALVNIGGVSNVTIIDGYNFYGFDIGPGNGPSDRISNERFNKKMDRGGKLALKGTIKKSVALDIIKTIKKISNKSYDRKELDVLCLKKTNKLKPENSLATMAFVVSELIKLKIKKFHPKKVILLGGGRKNLAIRSNLESTFKEDILAAEDYNINGDSVESQAIAYLAVRSLLGLEYTFRQTTNVISSLSGGVLHNYN